METDHISSEGDTFVIDGGTSNHMGRAGATLDPAMT